MDISVLDLYEVIIETVNDNANAAECVLVIKLADTIAPVIELNGIPVIELELY